MKSLIVRRQRWGLTWIGRLLVFGLMVALCVCAARRLGTFLAITQPVGGQFLVVESWIPAFALREAVTQFRRGGYQKIIAAGQLYEDCGAGEVRGNFVKDMLLKFGIPTDLVVTASTDEVQWDRTFHAAMAVKRWLFERGLQTTSIDVVTLGPHARRSRLLYRRAFGQDTEIGVIAVNDRRFDISHWWRTSAGARTVVGESIAYLYTRISSLWRQSGQI